MEGMCNGGLILQMYNIGKLWMLLQCKLTAIGCHNCELLHRVTRTKAKLIHDSKMCV